MMGQWVSPFGRKRMGDDEFHISVPDKFRERPMEDIAMIVLPEHAANLLIAEMERGNLAYEPCGGWGDHLVVKKNGLRWIVDMYPLVYCEDESTNRRYTYHGDPVFRVTEIASICASKVPDIADIYRRMME